MERASHNGSVTKMRDISAVCERLNVGYPTVWQLIHRGKFAGGEDRWCRAARSVPVSRRPPRAAGGEHAP